MRIEANIGASLEEKRRYLENIKRELAFNYRDKLLCPRIEDSVLCLRNMPENVRIVSFIKDCKVCVHRIVGEEEFVICEPPKKS